MGHQTTILVAEDDLATQRLYHDELEDEGYKVIAVGNGYEVLFNLENEKVDLIITDTSMPLMGAFEMVKKVHQQQPDVPVVVITGHHNEEEFTKNGCEIQAFFRKPVKIKEVKSVIQKLLGKKP